MYSSFRLTTYRTKFHSAPYSYSGVYREVWPKLKPLLCYDSSFLNKIGGGNMIQFTIDFVNS
jgi:hypothetical protein